MAPTATTLRRFQTIVILAALGSAGVNAAQQAAVAPPLAARVDPHRAALDSGWRSVAMATRTGISGDRFYKNVPGADFTTFTDAWANTNIRSEGPLGKLYPVPCCIHEGDTPAFLGLIDNGLASAMRPTYGGWGGRYVWRQF